MSAVRDFFSSLKEDLFGKRLLPFLIVLGVVLVAAVAYAALGGGSSSSPTPVTASAPAGASVAVGDVAVSQAPANPNEPISETTERHVQAASRHRTRSVHAAAGSEASVIREHDVQHRIVLEPHHHTFRGVDAIFFKLWRHDPQGNNAGEAEGLRPLPRDRAARRRARGGRRRPGAAGPAEDLQGHGARRTASRQGQPAARVPRCRAAHGQGSAVRAHRRGDPARERQSASRAPRSVRRSTCRSARARRLEVVEADGSTVTYELKLVSIDKSVSTASTARVRDAFRAQAKAARELARRAPQLSELRYSPWGGGFVFAGHPAFAARAPSCVAAAAGPRDRLPEGPISANKLRRTWRSV